MESLCSSYYPITINIYRDIRERIGFGASACPSCSRGGYRIGDGIGNGMGSRSSKTVICHLFQCHLCIIIV